MPGRRPPRLGGTLILAVLALAAAGGGLRCRPANREIIVGSILSLSGEGEYYGKHIQQGMNLAVEELNRRGGIQGRPLRVVYRDSRSRPEAGRIHAEDLYRNLRIPAIIGAVLSSVTLAIAPIAESERRILLSPASSSPKITQAGSFIFRNYPSDVLEGAYMAEFASRELHLQRIAVLSVDNEYGKGLREIFR
ncbi:MAG: ABC transporter substrate-binding protein, partial [Acidobacteriota bacterium]